jgi:hypothetical protein
MEECPACGISLKRFKKDVGDVASGLIGGMCRLLFRGDICFKPVDGTVGRQLDLERLPPVHFDGSVFACDRACQEKF